jgi:3-phosphoshikimate 1-carboxyvinyltransferase
MKVTIEKSTASGTVFAPPSKSMAHRLLICGALTENSVISYLSESKDILATIECLKNMGAKLESDGDTLKIGGINPQSISGETELFCNESGSTFRFLIPLCMVSGNRITLSGSSRLFERPLSVYEEICKEQNIEFERSTNSLTVCGKLTAGDFTVRGDISSQFITGLLFVLPLLCGDSTLTVTGNFESASYVDLTLDAMKSFGIDIVRKENVFYIKGNQIYQNKTVTVEGDYSNAAFLDAFNVVGGNVSVCGLKNDSLQGDRVYSDMFKGLTNGKKSFDLSDCPDLAPIMFAMAAYTGGAEFTGTARLKIKESDRASAMAEELLKFGIDVTVDSNSVTVHSGALKKPDCELSGHNDHRIVMSLSLLCSVTGGEIDGAEAVSKSYPDFFGQISQLGIIIKD